jgi:hypothetical protein
MWVGGMMNKRFCLLILLILFLFTGCGGGSGGSSTDAGSAGGTTSTQQNQTNSSSNGVDAGSTGGTTTTQQNQTSGSSSSDNAAGSTDGTTSTQPDSTNGSSNDGTNVGNTGGTTSTQQYSTAVLKISSQGTLNLANSIVGIDTTISIPVGVSLKTDLSGKVDTSIVTASGVAVNNSFVDTNYSPPSASSPGTLRIIFLNTTGISTGEFVTITADIATGAFPQVADFSISAFRAADGMGVVLSSITGLLSTVLK